VDRGGEVAVEVAAARTQRPERGDQILEPAEDRVSGADVFEEPQFAAGLEDTA
jgi:hypothetical protein